MLKMVTIAVYNVDEKVKQLCIMITKLSQYAKKIWWNEMHVIFDKKQ